MDTVREIQNEILVHTDRSDRMLKFFHSFQLLYCLQVYRGDEKIKNFIWDLITPTESGEENKISRNHSGLHNLVPRGRNAKGKIAQCSRFCTSVLRVLVF